MSTVYGKGKPRARRPWVGYVVLTDSHVSDSPVAVKILTIDPGQRASLQTHERIEYTTRADGLSALSR